MKPAGSLITENRTYYIATSSSPWKDSYWSDHFLTSWKMIDMVGFQDGSDLKSHWPSLPYRVKLLIWARSLSGSKAWDLLFRRSLICSGGHVIAITISDNRRCLKMRSSLLSRHWRMISGLACKISRLFERQHPYAVDLTLTITGLYNSVKRYYQLVLHDESNRNRDLTSCDYITHK